MKEVLKQAMTDLREDIKADTKMTIQEEIKKLGVICEQRYNENKKEIELLKATVQKQSKLLDSIRRSNNLIFHGIKMESHDAPLALEGKILDVSKNIMQIPLEMSELNRVIRLGKKGNENGPVLVTFVSYIKRLQVLKNAAKLKGSNITVSEDLSLEDRERRKFLVTLNKVLREKNHTCSIKRKGLMINGKFHGIEQLRTAEQDGTLLVDQPQPSQTEDMEIEQPHEVDDEATSGEDITQEEVEAARKRKRLGTKNSEKAKDNGAKGDLRTFFRTLAADCESRKTQEKAETGEGGGSQSGSL